jgi:hypothetical protein
MLRMTKLAFFLALTMTSGAFLEAQQPGGAAPVPAQILASNKAFISNAGLDGPSAAAFKREGDPDRPYKQFYAAMKSWGRYELVTAPGDADLIFEIRFTAQLGNCGDSTCYAPQFGLSILDAKSHFTLWTLTEPVQGAIRKATFDKNVNKGMANLMNDVKKLAGPSTSTADSAKN